MIEYRTRRHPRLLFPIALASGLGLLAGCSAAAPDEGGTEASEGGKQTGFTVMVPQANDEDDFWAQLIAQYSEETGTDIEVIPYANNAYITQVTTQLQSGNAADVMILVPGTGQPTSVVTLAEAGFLEPLSDVSASVIPEGTESMYEVDGEIFAQPAALLPVSMVWNPDAAEQAGVDTYPDSFDDLLESCATAREGGASFTALAGSAPPNNGLLAQIISATRVYAETPDWNEQRAAGEVTFVDSGWADVLEDIVTMNEEGCFQDGVAGGTFDTLTSNLGSGASLSAALPASAVPSISGVAGVDLTVQAFPPASGQKPYMLNSANNAWGVNAKSDETVKESAQAFLEWAAQPENAAEFARISGAVPITGVDPDTLAPSYEPVADLLEEGNYAALPNASWPNLTVYDALCVGIQGLFTGQTTVESVLESMDAAWGE